VLENEAVVPLFLASTPDGDECSSSRPYSFTLEETAPGKIIG
jgi:hypothetical protein